MKMRTTLSVAFVALGLSAALAEDNAAPGASPGTSDGAGASALTCINGGNSYKVGEFACIAACHGRRRLARCDAAATTSTSWTYVSDVCPSAMINPPWPSEWTEVPVLTAMSPVPLVVNLTAIPADDRIRFADFSRVQLAAR